MGVKSFKEVGLHAEGGALICDPKRILKKFNIDEHHKGDKHRNMSAADSFEQECGQLVDAFIAFKGLMDHQLNLKQFLIDEINETSEREATRKRSLG